MSEVLTAEGVDSLLRDCLAEDCPDPVLVEGIVSKYGFDPDRLHAHREAITAMLSQLPDQFKKSGGGGWSFLQACDDRNGHQWTGEHRVMEMLFALGMGLGVVVCQLPRDVWTALPGGMPYYEVLL